MGETVFPPDEANEKYFVHIFSDKKQYEMKKILNVRSIYSFQAQGLNDKLCLVLEIFNNFIRKTQK